MKKLSLLFLSVFIFSSLLIASPHFQRSLRSRLIGDEAYLPLNQEITLEKPIEDMSGTKVPSINLTTPRRIMNGNRLLLDGKRSVVLIDSSNIEDVPSEGLRKEILNVVNHRARTLKQSGIRYTAKGLDEFFVIGNFEASHTPGKAHAWHVAIIPKNVVVEKVILQTEWFGSGAGAHNQIRLVLDTPVVVIPQSEAPHTAISLNHYNGGGDIVYTLQAARVDKGLQNWSPLSGVMGEYGNALQIFDTRTLALDQISRSVIDDLTIFDNEKAANKEQAKDWQDRGLDILTQAIVDADSEQEFSIYNTVFASCVTYAMKALKAGVPGVSTTWFNPYSINLKVQSVLGRSTDLVKSSMNDDYGPILEELGGKVMSWQKINKENKQLTEVIRAVKPILLSKKFDQAIQKVALFVINEGITYDQVKDFVQRASATNVDIEELAQTEKSKKLLKKIQEILGDDISLEDFFKALKGLRTQA